MAPRNRNLIPDMRPTRYKTETFSNPYAPAQYAFTPKPSSLNIPKISAIPYGLTASEWKAYNTPDSNPIIAFLEGGGGTNFTPRAAAIGKVRDYKRDQRQAQEDKSTVNLFGRTVKTSDLLGVAASAALAGAGIAAVRTTRSARASTRSLAASRISNAQEIAANAREARQQFRRAVDARQAARRARQSTLVRADRLERIESALRDRDPGAAQAFGDRAYALRAGKTIRSEMRGAKGHDFTDSPFAGSHHSYTPMDQSFPASQMGLEWMRSSGRSVTDLGRLYSSGVPRGGYFRQPNLRRRTPITSQWTPDLKNEVIDPSAVDDFTRGRIAPLLDDASTFRNRSASFMQGNANPEGRYIFPRIYTNTRSYPQGAYDPAEYQLRSFYNYTSMLRRGTATTLPRSTRYVRPGQRKIGGGK